MPDTPPSTPLSDDTYPGWFLSVRRGVDTLTMGLNILGTLLILVVMVLVNADVIGRGMFNAPVSGVPEIVSMSIAAIVFLQIAHTFARDRLTRSEAILGFAGNRAPKARTFMELVFAIAAIALIWQVFSASLPLFRKSWVRNTFEGTIGDFTAPIWPVKLIILIGCAALMAQLVLFAGDALFRLIRKGTPT